MHLTKREQKLTIANDKLNHANQRLEKDNKEVHKKFDSLRDMYVELEKEVKKVNNELQVKKDEVTGLLLLSEFNNEKYMKYVKSWWYKIYMKFNRG